MSSDQREVSPREDSGQTSPEHAGDNRRAGDTDGNAANGDSKSKGADNPADEPPNEPQTDEPNE